jgi:carboxymethylenebutenolidase
MIEKYLSIKTPAGDMDAYVTYPEIGHPCPAIVIFMDIWGLREELFDVARRIAVAGYYCIVPNTYYRQGQVRFEFRNAKGAMLSIEELPPETQEDIRSTMRTLTDDMVVTDIRSVLAHLATEPVRGGPIGALGYCMGGRHALSVAAHYPDKFRATASLHGTRLVTDRPDSIHRLSDRFRGEVYCGFAERDSLAPRSTIETLATSLGKQPKLSYAYLVHPDTDHGYSLPDRDVYRKHAANRDWERIFAMFRRQLQASAAMDCHVEEQ